MEALIIYGPSGSGKTSFANKFISTEESPKYHIERDDVRFNLLKLGNWKTYKINHNTENLVDMWWKFGLCDAHIKGMDIVISDTLCKIGDRRKTEALLTGLGYQVKFIRMDTSIDDCLKRDGLRGDMSVGDTVIYRQWAHFDKNKEHV